MSQIYKSLLSGPVPPAVPTSFVTDDGTAIPLTNVLNVLGVNGIETLADPDGSNNLYISLANGSTVEATTVDAQTVSVNALDLGPVAGAFSFTTTVAGFDVTTNNASVGFFFRGLIQTNGAAATLVASLDNLHGESPTLVASNCTVSVSGNFLQITFLGVAGVTINWVAVTTGVFAE